MNIFVFAVVLALVAMLAWGINSFILKRGVRNIHPLQAIVYRSLVATPILLLLSYVLFAKDSIFVYFKPDLILWFTLGSSFFIVIGDSLFFLALKKYPVTLILPIASIYPLITTIILISTKTETIHITTVVGTIVVILGVSLVTGGSKILPIPKAAILYGLSIAFFWGSSIFMVRSVLLYQGTNAFSITAIRSVFMMVISIVVLGFIAIRSGQAPTPNWTEHREAMKFMGISGILGWVVGASSFFFAVQLIGAAIPTPITSANPVIAGLLGYFTGIEDIGLYQLLGILVTVIGTIIIIY